MRDGAGGARDSMRKVAVSNDADVVAAGIAATHGKLDQLVRVWTLGNGIGFGRYPAADGVWEGGHMVVSLDPNEKFCGCGGLGHLEGIMGHRAMRLRFLDMEPEEVFAAAEDGRGSALRRVRDAVASRAGGGDGVQHSHERSGEILHHRSERAVRERGVSESVRAGDGEDESAAGLRV